MNKQEKMLAEQQSPESSRRILGRNTSFAAREAYKAMRTNVRFTVHGGGCKKISITSGVAGEGKSITFLNYAISVAEAGQKVLLIDADLRRPALARLLSRNIQFGLSDVLAGLVSEKEAIQKNVYENLDILFAGNVPPNPSELLDSDSMKQVIEKLSSQYDYILVDTPPVNAVSDACIVGNLMDGVLLLVRQDSSRKDDVKRAVHRLKLTGTKLLGYILNDTTLEKRQIKAYYG